MKEEEIPELNIFMMCLRPERMAFSSLPIGYTVRSCTPADLYTWKCFPFDTDDLAPEYNTFMTEFFNNTYGHDPELFFRNTLFVCDGDNRPVATCSNWVAYGKFQSIHWFKTLKSHEGRGIGRALLSIVMDRFNEKDYPIFLHTQVASFRAIKLYADFGFELLSSSGERFGTRSNDLKEGLPILQKFMPEKDFNALRIVPPPPFFLDALKSETHIQF